MPRMPTGPGSPPLERSCQRGDDVNHKFRHGPTPTPGRTRLVLSQGGGQPRGVTPPRDARRDVLCADRHLSAVVLCSHLPRHRHGACEGGIVGDELHGLHHPHVRHDVRALTAMAGVTRSVRIISTSPVLAFGVAVAVIARTERAICSASSRSACRPRVGPDGTLHLDNRHPGRGQLPRAAQESQWCGGGRAGHRTHPHASHDAAPFP